MRSILIGSVPIHGHVSPLLAVAEHFVRRGDSVRFLTGARFAEAVTAVGATHLPLPADADYDDRDSIASFPGREGLTGAKAIAFDVENIFVRPGRAQYEALLAALTDQKADVVIVDPTFAGAAYLTTVPRTARPPIVVGGVLPLGLSSPDTAPFGMGLPPARFLNRLRNRLLSIPAGRLIAKAEALAATEHQELHGIPLPVRVLDWTRAADAIAQFTVAEFEYPRSDAPDILHFVGPMAPSTHSTGPLPEWWHELDGPTPVVHVTQGTVANQNFGDLIAPTLEALADEDVLVVVSTGGRPVSELPPLPANARAAEFLPYDLLLPKTDVYVTNGGYGGVQMALREGIPVVATGATEDKPEVCARIEWAGVGRRIKRPTPSALRKAVHDVIGEPRFRLAAQSLSHVMKDAPGLAGLEAIVDDMTTPDAAGCASRARGSE